LREEWNVIKEGQLGTDTDLLALEITFWKEKLAVTEKGSKDYIDIHTHLVDLETQLNKRTTEEQNKAAKQVQDAWVATFESIPKAWESAVSSLKNTTAGWGDFFRSMMRDLAVEYAAFEARQIVIHNAAWLEKRKADIAGFLFGKLLLVEQTIVVVAQYAIQAAAAAWAAIAGIPVVGPILAPVVALGDPRWRVGPRPRRWWRWRVCWRVQHGIRAERRPVTQREQEQRRHVHHPHDGREELPRLRDGQRRHDRQGRAGGRECRRALAGLARARVVDVSSALFPGTLAAMPGLAWSVTKVPAFNSKIQTSVGNASCARRSRPIRAGRGRSSTTSCRAARPERHSKPCSASGSRGSGAYDSFLYDDPTDAA
jgi:hypothetical protein